MRDGKGIYVSESGEMYRGEWRLDLAWGKGEFRSLHPIIEYEGDWAQGNKHGNGH